MYSSPSPLLSARGSGPALLVVGLCWLAVLFDGLDMFIYGSVLPHLLETRTFGLTADTAGDLGSYATFGMLVGALVAGTVADRIGRKKLMVSCVILFSLASGVCALAGSVTVFGLGRTLAGVGLGGLLPNAISMVSDYAPRGRGALVHIVRALSEAMSGRRRGAPGATASYSGCFRDAVVNGVFERDGGAAVNGGLGCRAV